MFHQEPSSPDWNARYYRPRGRHVAGSSVDADMGPCVSVSFRTGSTNRARLRIRPVSYWGCLVFWHCCSVGMLFGCGAVANSSADSITAAEPLENPELLVRRGEDALRAGDSLRAEQYLVLAMNQGVERNRVMPLLIRACLEGGRLRAALGYADTHLAEHPDDWPLRFLVATIHTGLGQDGAAIVELRRILGAEPSHAESHYLLGTLLAGRDPGGASEHFREYLLNDPHGTHASAARGWLALTERVGRLAVHESHADVTNASGQQDLHGSADLREAASTFGQEPRPKESQP